MLTFKYSQSRQDAWSKFKTNARVITIAPKPNPAAEAKKEINYPIITNDESEN